MCTDDNRFMTCIMFFHVSQQKILYMTVILIINQAIPGTQPVELMPLRIPLLTY